MYEKLNKIEESIMNFIGGVVLTACAILMYVVGYKTVVCIDVAIWNNFLYHIYSYLDWEWMFYYYGYGVIITHLVCLFIGITFGLVVMIKKFCK